MRLLKLLINPNPQELRRPDIEGSSVEEVVRAIIQGVKEGGDQALRNYTKEFDRADIDSLKVPLPMKEDLPEKR